MAYQAPPTRREAIVRHLREEIVTGGLAPDTVLKDGEIAARLGVSITPVREALAQLTAEGLVGPGPARTRRVTRVTRKNALDLIDVMMVLACAGAEQGAPNLRPEDIAAMRRRLGESERALAEGDVASATEAGVDVSTILISASGNEILQQHVDLVVARTLRLLAYAPDSGVWSLWVPAYGEIIDLLERGDTQAAVARYRQTFADYREWLTRVQFPAEGLT